MHEISLYPPNPNWYCNITVVMATQVAKQTRALCGMLLPIMLLK